MYFIIQYCFIIISDISVILQKYWSQILFA